QAEDGIRDFHVTGVQTCALPIYAGRKMPPPPHSRRSLPQRAGRSLRSSPLFRAADTAGETPLSEQTTSAAAEALRAGNRVVLWAIAAIVVILALAAVLLFLSLPDANAFNARVERIFFENDALTTGVQIKLLEILAQSGTTISEVLTSYRTVIFVLLVFSTALLVAALVF